ncbi:hypothetical protein [Acanthopleuribacter pedis]|uniref:Uncharacterized protein n=1 Tax=Acanthopleuribacter pedis TaxID=442870 RepID=A0A8J7Q4H7_9BACT|nr:hypothetical protein [Acanthopleuribacter pedis]MBO1320437.1 hypothetical protein [Acanthopleuribacter pedis]
MAKNKKRQKAASEQAKELRKLMGRRDWGGINPVTRVMPNKKKDQRARKAKHKGRGFDPYLAA